MFYCTSRDAYARPKFLVGIFQAGCGIDRIAVSGKVEAAIAAEISDDRLPGVDADPCRSERNASSALLITELHRKCIHSARAGDGSNGVVGLIDRRIENDVYGITDQLHDGPAV